MNEENEKIEQDKYLFEYKFNDAKLNKIYEEYEQTIKISTEELNKISQDIKNIEQVLSKIPISRDRSTFHIQDVGILYYHNKRIYLEEKMSEPKHLSETKANVRIIVSKYLPEFFEFCIKNMGK